MTNIKMPATKQLLLDLDHFLSTTFCLKACDLRKNKLFCYKFLELSILIFQCHMAFCLETDYTIIENMSFIKKH